MLSVTYELLNFTRNHSEKLDEIDMLISKWSSHIWEWLLFCAPINYAPLHASYLRLSPRTVRAYARILFEPMDTICSRKTVVYEKCPINTIR